MKINYTKIIKIIYIKFYNYNNNNNCNFIIFYYHTKSKYNVLTSLYKNCRITLLVPVFVRPTFSALI